LGYHAEARALGRLSRISIVEARDDSVLYSFDA
jgi:hypothetical protein